ncbi:SHOCT domain-containing protein [Cohnella luojiensis]|uniref:SHOCT domain-containing protein n=1 Tax=Cohnella luojiensis TaxID=652876 RepID=A0A4Y8M4Z0_9BACL|nr:SHOCT domain-containing protein [Cohnella luojiensis]TFE27465.1 SHOCT domain-containing protein [Cohnella luojiensis]
MVDGSMMNGSMMEGSMMAMCIMMGIGLLIFVIVVGLTVYLVTRMLMKKSRLEDRPLMILKERYVKGEINDEEYKQKRNLLFRHTE